MITCRELIYSRTMAVSQRGGRKKVSQKKRERERQKRREREKTVQQVETVECYLPVVCWLIHSFIKVERNHSVKTIDSEQECDVTLVIDFLNITDTRFVTFFLFLFLFLFFFFFVFSSHINGVLRSEEVQSAKNACETSVGILFSR